MLYTLSPPGNVLIVPDGLWLASRWAGMLAGAALRGCRVFIVAPALANAPSAGFPQMSRIQEVMLRLLEVRQEFTNEIKKAGGELRVGLYTAKEDVNDIAQQSRAVRAGMDRYPWLHDLVRSRRGVLAVLDSAPPCSNATGTVRSCSAATKYPGCHSCIARRNSSPIPLRSRGSPRGRSGARSRSRRSLLAPNKRSAAPGPACTTTA